MKNGKVKLQLPDCNRVYELGEAKSGCVPSGITNAAQRGDEIRSGLGENYNKLNEIITSAKIIIDAYETEIQ